mmetsp:Transcript_2152/g.6808  ORF Transcript_2152/g.6808 Transcript_2152/m.6808 type:complete len:204 (+) Transcript_2152:1376-1987(+)
MMSTMMIIILMSMRVTHTGMPSFPYSATAGGGQNWQTPPTRTVLPEHGWHSSTPSVGSLYMPAGHGMQARSVAWAGRTKVVPRAHVSGEKARRGAANVAATAVSSPSTTVSRSRATKVATLSNVSGEDRMRPVHPGSSACSMSRRAFEAYCAPSGVRGSRPAWTVTFSECTNARVSSYGTHRQAAGESAAPIAGNTAYMSASR